MNNTKKNKQYIFSPKFLVSQEFKKNLNTVISLLENIETSNRAFSGTMPKDTARIAESINILPDVGLGFEKTMEEISSKVLSNMVKTFSLGYMAHLHCPILKESFFTEMFITAFNQSMDSWDQSPIGSEIEIAVIKLLCKLFGYDKNSDGVFSSGGTQSNMTALMLARDNALKKIGVNCQKNGLGSYSNKLRIYTSEISHFSVQRSSHLMGLGEDSVVLVKTDNLKKIDTKDLEEKIKRDIKNNLLPIAVVATCGTTDFGSIDDVDKLADICKKYNIHLHTDATYGGAVIMSKNAKSKLGSINKSDSISIDFHKMFLLPISCSALIVKNSDLFSVLAFHSDYLNREEDEIDGYDNLVSKSLQTTRRLDALKVLISFMIRGKDGWQDLIDTMLNNAQILYQLLKERSDIETYNIPELTSVLFRVLPSNKTDIDIYNKELRRKLLHKDGIVIGQTIADDKIYLKCTLLNPDFTKEELIGFVNMIQ